MVPKSQECLEFGKMVRAYREQSGYSQEGLSNKARIHRTYIGGIERGERNPTLTMIHRLARALEISPSQLLEKPSGTTIREGA